jgi:hypothetical protein
MPSTYNHLFKTFIVGGHNNGAFKTKKTQRRIDSKLVPNDHLQGKKKGGHGSKRVSQNNESNLS